MHTYILLFQCKDQPGIVAKVSDFIFRHGGNMISLDQHTTDPEGGDLFMRIEFVVKDAATTKAQLEKDIQAITAVFNAECDIYDKSNTLKMGIMVSRPDHCLFELLYLWRSEELRVEIPFVISNYAAHEEIVRQHNIKFHFIPAVKSERKEKEISEIVKDSDFLVLARYMLVFSPEFLKAYARDIINIHHGFLPSFRGIDPYQKALGTGVKVIGATAHFTSEKLDEGPIITQAVEPVSHRDNLISLINKGKNLEKRALAEAVLRYVDYRIIKHGNKTIVF